ncbi:MAG TPA: hypothetical protein VKV80_12795 [Streptosporangiaceae bacterium]|nr:hypothetical protein [Streptosporangiaceae bacterium]
MGLGKSPGRDTGEGAGAGLGGAAGAERACPDGTAGVEGAREPAWTLANEFAEVRVSLVHTRNGVRLRICDRRGGRAVELCPLELEALTWQSPEVFSGFLATPFGPEEAADPPGPQHAPPSGTGTTPPPGSHIGAPAGPEGPGGTDRRS